MPMKSNTAANVFLLLFFLIFMTLLISFARASTFDDLWLVRIKPQPYGGVATTFNDRMGAWDNSLNHNEYICAHMLEKRGQHLKIVNLANGKFIICRVEDRGPHRRFWPRREVDLSTKANKAIECDGYCEVSIERVSR